MAQTWANESTTTWNTKFKRVVIDKATAAVAIDATLSPAAPFQLLEIRLKAASALAAEALTLTLIKASGTAYNAVLHSADMDGLTSYSYQFADEMRYFTSGDSLKLEHANTGTVAIGIEIVYALGA